MMEESQTEREFFRAEARLQVFWGADTLAGRQAMAMDSDMWERQSQLEVAAREVLEESGVAENMRPMLTVIRWLDFKLDLILHHLRSREQATHFPGQGTTTDISGSGFGLADPLDLPPGTRILISLGLPDAPSRPVCAVGEVVRVREDLNSTGAAAAVRFLELGESDRERIIRYTFTQQRRLLAQRMEGDKE